MKRTCRITDANCKNREIVCLVKCQGCIEKRRNDGLYVRKMIRSIGERISERLAEYEVKDKAQ